MFYPLVQRIRSGLFCELVDKNMNPISRLYSRTRIAISLKSFIQIQTNHSVAAFQLANCYRFSMPRMLDSSYNLMMRPDRHDLVNRSLAQFQSSQLRTIPIKAVLALLLALAISLSVSSPAEALEIWPLGGKSHQSSQGPLPIHPSSPGGHLQEVAPPGGVQSLRDQLDKHDPQLKLQSPADGAVLSTEDWELVLSLKDWPLASDPELGLGAHLVVQIDDAQPLRISESEKGLVRIPMNDVRPGSHRFSAYAAYPWGEAVHRPKASLQWRLHQYQAMEGTQPSQDAPWLVSVSPAELNVREPFLLDWLIWNAPLQNIRDEDGRWRLRVTINGDSFLLDRQEAIWMQGLPSGTATVQLELLDGLGEPIEPVFNNQLRLIQAKASDRAVPAWMQPRLNDLDLARLLGEAAPPGKIMEPGDAPQLERPFANSPSSNNTHPSNTASNSTSTNSTSTNSPASNSTASNMAASNNTAAKSPGAGIDPSDTRTNETRSRETNTSGTNPAETITTDQNTPESLEDPADAEAQKPEFTNDLNNSASDPEPALEQLPTSSLGGSAGGQQNPDVSQQPF